MSKIDKVFGQLEYNYFWYKEMSVTLFGKDQEVTLIIEGESDEDIEEEQYEAYANLIKKLDDKFYSEILNKILEYYKETRHELGYEDEEDERYPPIETVEEITKHIKFKTITIQDIYDEGERRVGLTFDCTWDEEQGIGIQLLNENIDEIGAEDLVL